MGKTRSGTGLIAGVLAGLLAGWVLGTASRPSTRAPQSRSQAASDARTGVREDSAPSATLSPVTQVSARIEEAREERDPIGGLFTDPLREHARAGIVRGWSKMRGDPMPEAELAEALGWVERGMLEGPESIGKHFAEQETEAEQPDEEEEQEAPDPLEAFRAHDPIALLERIDEENDMKPRLELVNDADGFEQLFPSRSGRVLDGGQHLADPDTAIEDGTVLDFPAGVFRLRHLMRRKDPFPSDVTLRGAGMDATLLLLDHPSTNGRLRNFTLRDCTVFTDDPFQSAPAAMRLERVRVIGFDCGAGGSSLFAGDSLALLARSSRFEGGYGRAPWSGNLFDVRSPALLARFEGCRIDGVALPMVFTHPGSSVAFVDCSLTDLLDGPEHRAHGGIVFPGSTVAFFPGERAEAPEFHSIAAGARSWILPPAPCSAGSRWLVGPGGATRERTRPRSTACAPRRSRTSDARSRT
jgi:hypothetical protein